MQSVFRMVYMCGICVVAVYMPYLVVSYFGHKTCLIRQANSTKTSSSIHLFGLTGPAADRPRALSWWKLNEYSKATCKDRSSTSGPEVRSFRLITSCYKIFDLYIVLNHLLDFLKLLEPIVWTFIQSYPDTTKRRYSDILFIDDFHICY
jgi:hypothetical protein